MMIGSQPTGFPQDARRWLIFVYILTDESDRHVECLERYVII